jgi:hypothetical protein
VTEHALDEDRNGGEAQFFQRQVGDIGPHEEFADVEVAARRLTLPLDVVVIDSNGEIDVFGFDAAVDERARGRKARTSW